jgi:aspartate oxidase
VLHLNPDFRVALLTKSANESSSYLSQGGIAAVINPEDSEGSHYRDTLTAGAGLCDKDAVRLLVREGPSEIEKLLNWETDINSRLASLL